MMPESEYLNGILYRGGKRVQELVDADYIDLAIVPREHEMHVRPSMGGVPFREPYVGEGAVRAIASLGALWAVTRPHEAIPFQWSVHAEHEDGRVEHFECLVTDVTRSRGGGLPGDCRCRVLAGAR